MSVHDENGDAPNTKFDEDMRQQYLGFLEEGSLKQEAAARCGISYRTVERRLADDEGFRKAMVLAMAKANEEVEKVLRDMALEGDLGAIKMWLTANARSTYADNKTLTLDATPAAVETSKNSALAQIAKLQGELAERAERLRANDGVIDVPSEEVTDVSQLPPAPDVTDESQPFTI